MVQTRSRTGCLTCRQRKLKCDEQKPICGQCHKASRECRASESVVFRHQQNPSMNAAGSRSGGNLSSFFGYRSTFDPNQTWVKIPPQITFVHTNNPYDDDELDVDPALATEPQTSLDAPRADWDLDATYRPSTSDFVAHSLEHLAAAASDQNPYNHARGSGAANGMIASSPHYAPYHSPDVSPPLATSARGMLANTSPTGSYSSNNNINSILNHSTTLSTVIDPLLQRAIPRQPAVSDRRVAGGKPGQKEARKGKVQDDHEMAALLRGIAEEHPGHRNEGSLVTNG